MASTIAECPICHFPISADYEGQNRTCANCSAKLEAIAQNGVTIPTPVFVGLIAFGLGVLIGPALVASTSGGRDWLEKQAREATRR